MSKQYFKNLESADVGERRSVGELVENIRFDEQGLISVVSQDSETSEVLMLAYMDREALRRTLDSGHMTFWSRSRNTYWRKGETSGHVQNLIEMRVDCDGDALLCKVEQTGPACHTNRRGCFYLRVSEDATTVEVVDSIEPVRD